ncbi:unnamed protein product [Schistosoma curassoni]|uniref:ABC transporter domain-containing protein n=1 Tax=Schistosoma curassoni TaxID=6186 RepID=A0A183KZD4_9TREM|nr:unnamed protein product [Schistosoma curassoni]
MTQPPTQEKLTRIAIVSSDKCKPKKCRQECKRSCPVVRMGKRLLCNLEKEVTHRYGPNSFKLHRLPMPRPGEVLGLVGTNGIGKSSALKILAGKLKPNLGRFKNPPDWTEILTYFRGSELQNYFTKILEDNLKAVIKPQYVDQIPKIVSGEVKTLLNRKDDRGNQDHVLEMLGKKTYSRMTNLVYYKTRSSSSH